MAPARLKILLVGSLPPPLGGCAVTLQLLVEELRRRDDVEVRVLDTAGIRAQGLRGALRFAAALRGLVRGARPVDLVTLHVATTAVPLGGLLVLAASRLAGRPFVLRKFGGTDYRRLGPIRGWRAHLVARRADLYLTETREHLALALARGIAGARWFPTARPDGPAPGARERSPDEGCCRFVYVGHVCRAKGLRELVEAWEQVPPEATLDVYGPLFDDLPRGFLDGRPRIAYHGPIPAAEVAGVLARHHVLVLPTLADTEGYPGSIVEALMAGLPVVATRVGAIPELVDEAVGCLVDPGDARQLGAAMARLCQEPELYRSLRQGTRARGSAFSSRRWSEEFVRYCTEAAAARGAA